jgi:hypothetical protein
LYYTDEANDYTNAIVGYLNGTPIPFGIASYSAPTSYKEYAAFGDVTYHFTHSLDAQLGVRFSRNDQEIAETYSPGLVSGPTVSGILNSENVTTYLATALDTWGPREPLVKVRDAINAGHLTGSRIFLGGNIIGMGGPTSPDFYPAIRTVINKVDADRIDAMWEQGVGADLLWMTPSEVREKVSTYIHSGRIDFVKYLSSGHKEMQFIAFSPDAQKAFVEEAHRAGLTAQAHSTSPSPLDHQASQNADASVHRGVRCRSSPRTLRT